METSVLPPRPAEPDTGGGWANGLLMVLGQMLLSVALLFFVLADGYLDTINPTLRPFGSVVSNPIEAVSFLHVGLILIAMVACAGRPFPRGESRALPGAFSQAIGGLNVIGTVLVAEKVSNSLNFFQPDTRCVYDTCWPMGEQGVALVTPLIIVGTVMFAAALLVRRWSWRWRALLPPTLALALLIVQHVLWYSWLLPIFRQPPA